MNRSLHNTVIALTTAVLLLSSASAFGFRCGRKLVIENMHEAQVRIVCGAPTSARNLGFVLRNVYVPIRQKSAPGVIREQYPGYGPLTEQVVLTEYVYNFGPRKLMRRLLFEGGVLVKIETLGYGYHEKKQK